MFSDPMLLGCIICAPLLPLCEPTVSADEPAIVVERNGLLVGEAEAFATQTRKDVRAFHRVAAGSVPEIMPDGDPPHLNDASGGAYLEVLPDTRRTHVDRLVRGENFSPQPGQMAVLSYPIRIETPGRYYVWVRAFSTGTEDNGLHVGIDNTWPASGQRLQWCRGKKAWRRESLQRTEENHCGEPHRIHLDIETAGDHTLHFSMREDGFEFDKWLMTRDRDFVRPPKQGPGTTVQRQTTSDD